MKILQIGLGSMGKRRIRNCLHNGIKKENIFGFDVNSSRCQEAVKKYKIKTYSNFKEAVQMVGPDIFIISTPPDAHSKYFLKAAEDKKHVFVEHTTVDTGYWKLLKLLDSAFVAVPSCSWRFYPAVKKLKEIVAKGKIGKILSFQYHMGQYLPDWHPWEDYREVYFSKKITGACREMFTFELGWLSYILNLKAIKIGGFTKKISDLDMPADDIYSAIVSFKNNIIGTMVIDLLSKKAFRTLRIIGSDGVLEWEWLDNKIKLFEAKNKKTQIIKLTKGRSEKNYVTTEDMYEEEIKNFLDAISKKKKYPFTFKENHYYLKIMFALEKSSQSGKIVSI